MHPQSKVDAALRMVAEGVNDCEIGRRLGISRSTVRDWRCGRGLKRDWGRPDEPDCICSGEIQDAGAYAYLLGLYLGDGCLTPMPRGVYKLRIVLDERYTDILTECRAAIVAVRPQSQMKVGNVQGKGCIEVNAHWKHWPCLFPQHGPGRKHTRRITLRGWQQEIADTQPDLLLRGLIHSDGWRGLNRVSVRGKSYEYPRYQFCNHSEDILRIFSNACDAFEVPWRRMNRWNIAVSRKEAVAKLDQVVGLKT